MGGGGGISGTITTIAAQFSCRAEGVRRDRKEMGVGEVRGGASNGGGRRREGIGWRGISNDLGPLDSDLGPERAPAATLGDARSSNNEIPRPQTSRDVDRGYICRA